MAFVMLRQMLRRAAIVRNRAVLDTWEGFGPGASE
jgi:hypothetical protein